MQNALLLSREGKAEMKVAVLSETLGRVELHTVVRDDVVRASIGVEGRQAQHVLASALPSLVQGLAERHLQIEQIAVYDRSFGSQASLSGDSGSTAEQRSQTRQDSPGNITTASTGLPLVAESQSEEETGRLSVHA